jgi:hypothetical protein
MGKLDRFLKMFEVGKSVRKPDHARQIWEGILAYREQYNRIKEIDKLIPGVEDDPIAMTAISDAIGMASMVSEMFDMLGIGAITKDDMLHVLKTLHNMHEIMANFSNLERSVRDDRSVEEDEALQKNAARYNARVGMLSYAIRILESMTFRDVDIPPLRRGIRAALDEKKRWEAYMDLARMGDEFWVMYHMSPYGLIKDV